MKLNHLLIGKKYSHLINLNFTDLSTKCRDIFKNDSSNNSQLAAQIYCYTAFLKMIPLVLLDGSLDIDLLRLTLATQNITMHNHIDPSTNTLQVSAIIKDISLLDNGELLSIELSIKQNSSQIAHGMYQFFIRNMGRSKHQPTNDNKIKQTIANEIFNKKLIFDKNTINKYCFLVGDPNPIYTDDDWAKISGLPKPIVPQTMILPYLCSLLKNNDLNFNSIELKYKKPIATNEQVSFSCYKDAKNYTFYIIDSHGTIACHGDIK